MTRKAHKKTRAAPTLIKKYPNRRLYDTDQSCYVTLEKLAARVGGKDDFVVIDDNTKEDITRSILVQIIHNQEITQEKLLSSNALKTLIGFYESDSQTALSNYLEKALKIFTKNQKAHKARIEKEEQMQELENTISALQEERAALSRKSET